MSPEKHQAARRTYRKRRRAEQEEETRLRITEAAVDLHGSIGPAKTTISAIAERAGVQRATVYRHFADEEALFGACSAHWIASHPLPDLAEWAAVDDPAERLRIALAELYAWYARGEYMLENTIRDAALVPAMQPAAEAFAGWFGEAAGTLLSGRAASGACGRRVAAAVGHAVEFHTWRSLVRQQGLTEADAVGLMAELVDAAARS